MNLDPNRKREPITAEATPGERASQAALEELARAVAPLLGARWVAEIGYKNGCYIRGAGGRLLAFSSPCSHRRGPFSIVIRGMIEDDLIERATVGWCRIRVSSSSTPERVARQIKSRLLPVYEISWYECHHEEKKKRSTQERHTARISGEAAQADAD